MAASFRCVHCQRALRISGCEPGAKVSCPFCSKALTVPSNDDDEHSRWLKATFPPCEIDTSSDQPPMVETNKSKPQKEPKSLTKAEIQGLVETIKASKQKQANIRAALSKLQQQDATEGTTANAASQLAGKIEAERTNQSSNGTGQRSQGKRRFYPSLHPHEYEPKPNPANKLIERWVIAISVLSGAIVVLLKVAGTVNWPWSYAIGFPICVFFLFPLVWMILGVGKILLQNLGEIEIRVDEDWVQWKLRDLIEERMASDLDADLMGFEVEEEEIDRLERSLRIQSIESKRESNKLILRYFALLFLIILLICLLAR